MDKQRFTETCNLIVNKQRERKGIGTLGEKTLHAVLKSYFEPYEDSHEIKLGSFVADIVGENGIIEIQTGSFDRLRKKLEAFLAVAEVTVVYPIASTKYLVWIDEKTGEETKQRKSTKRGTLYKAFDELYKIKQLLVNQNLHLCIVMVDMVEYRILNGWSDDKKKGSSRYERIPTDIVDEIYINSIFDYNKFIPDHLPNQFTVKDYKKATGLNGKTAQTAVHVLNYIGAIVQTGKSGRAFLYERNISVY